MRTLESIVERDGWLNTHTKVGIDGLIGPFSHRLTSHKASWAFMLKNQMNHIGLTDVTVLGQKDEWSEYDVIIIDWGMEFKGTFNVFGGASDALADRLQQFVDYLGGGGTVISAHIECPNIAIFVQDRWKTGTPMFKNLDPVTFDIQQQKVDYFDHVFSVNNIVLGDSHSLSAYHPDHMILRHDGLTLHGALKRGLESLLVMDEPHETISLVLYFGNIDVRHHLMRQPDPLTSALELVVNLETQLLALGDLDSCTIIGLLPVEHEERQLAKTGWYKDAPFYGSREERQSLVISINEGFHNICRDNDWRFQAWPAAWYEMDPKEFAEKHMEARQGVHLRRSSYLYDFETGKKNFV